MTNKKNQSNVGQMIQRCHKWRQKRKQYIDQARQTSDEIERERLLQTAEHYGRIVNAEQGKIDLTRDPKDKTAAAVEENVAETSESGEDEDAGFPDFITNLK
jgi:F0F1-type ATP synthase membrane subunit b/b'